MTSTPPTAEQVLAAVLARTGPVTVYGGQVDAAEPAEIVAIHQAFGPQAHRSPMTLCLRRHYNGEAFGPTGDFADDEDRLTLTDTVGRHAVVTRRSFPHMVDLIVDPAGVVLAPAHVDALATFLTGVHADAGDLADIHQDLHELRAAAARDLEAQLQETGRQRTRADAAEQLLRRLLEDNVEAVVDDTDVLWHVRVLLGVDGRTGDPVAAVDRLEASRDC